MVSPQTPSEALDITIARATWAGGARRPKGKPGEFVASMSEEIRAQLRGLKSDDIAPGKLMAYAAYIGDDSGQRMKEYIRSECLKFDRDVLRLN